MPRVATCFRSRSLLHVGLVLALVACSPEESKDNGGADASAPTDGSSEVGQPDGSGGEAGSDVALLPDADAGVDAITDDVAPSGPLVPVPGRVGPNGEVGVQFSDGSTDPAAWIGMYAAGAADDAFVAQLTTGGATEGSLVFPTPAAIGQYEFRMFSDATTTTKLGSAAFVVEMPYDLDPAFAGGKVTFDFLQNTKPDWVCGVRGLAGGKVIVAGTAKTGQTGPAGWESNEFALARLNADGTLDDSFAQGGRAHLAMTTHDLAGCAAFDVQEDGKYLLAGWGYSETSTADFVIARFDTEGNPDAGFGTGGLVTTNFKVSDTDPGQWDKIATIRALSGGGILAGGSMGYNGTGSFSSVAFARYLANGAPDTSFNGIGTVVLEKKSWLETARSVVAGYDGSFYAGISDDGPYASNTTSVAHVMENGTLDPSFGNLGVTVEPLPSGPDERRLLQVLLTPAGSIVSLGQIQGSWFLGSYSSSTGAVENGGPVLATFGSAGARAAEMALAPDGMILVGISPEAWDGVNGVDGNFGLVRHAATGLIDLSFGKLRWKWDQGATVIGSRVTAIDVQPDGKVLLAGFIDRGGGTFDFDFAIVRLVKNPAW